MFTVNPSSYTSLAQVQRHITGLRDAVRGPARLDATVRGAQIILDEAKRRCPRGRETTPPHVHLADTLGVRLYEHTPARTRVGVGTDDPRGAYVEFGTPPHEITPRRRRALFWPGAAHPVTRVMHPGGRARPFLKPAADAKVDQVRGQFIGVLIAAARAAGRTGGRTGGRA
jgi:hypothetical protein